MQALRDVFGDTLVSCGKKNKKLVAVSCDLKEATRLSKFFNAFPERSFEVGIAEANAIGIASGLALSGFRPVISSFGAFITGKNVEIRTSISYNNAPVIIIGTHGGLIGPDGATQSGLQDIAIMRTIPNIKVFQPSSPNQTKGIIEYVCETNDMVYVRIARNKVPEIYNNTYKFKPYSSHILLPGEDITIFSSGPILHSCIQAAKELSNKVSIKVCDIPSLKPVNKDFIIENSIKSNLIFTFEDHNIEGGLGSIVSEIITMNGIKKKVLRFGLDDEFIISGTPNELEKYFHLDSSGIKDTIIKYL